MKCLGFFLITLGLAMAFPLENEKRTEELGAQVNMLHSQLISCNLIGSTPSVSRLTLSLPESNLELINVVENFESVDETLVCDHLNESY